MNSALQCVSNIRGLTEYFLEGTFKQHLNRSNVLGTQGGVALAYSEFINNVWSGKLHSFAPNSLKRNVAQHAPQFIDFRQQDSQEFMNFLLDALHEDLKVSDDDNDCNNSRIAKLFHSKMRSTVQCSACSRLEVTDSNVCFLPLPISCKQKQLVDSSSKAKRQRRSEEITFEVTFVSSTEAYKNYEVEICENATVHSLIEIFLEKYKSVLDQRYDCADIVAVQLSKSEFIRELNRSELLSLIPKLHTIALYYLPYHVNSSDQKTLWCDFYEFNKSSTFRPPIYIAYNDHNCTIETIHNKLEKALPSALFLPSKIKLVIEDRAKNCCLKDSLDRYQIYLFDHSKSFENKMLSITINYKPSQIKVQANAQIVNNYRSSQSDSAVSSATPSNTTLQQCMEEFLEPEYLGANGQWYCNTCRRLTDATKKLDFAILAPILIIQLKRFNFSRTSNVKIDTFVDYPVADSDMSMLAINSSDKSARYNLIAVSNHSGTLSSGHYWTTAKNFIDGRWYRFNDSSVTPLDESAIVSRNAYVLVYSRQ